MSATYQAHLRGRRSPLPPKQDATRLELVAAWKERHGHVDMPRLSGTPRPNARAAA